MRCESISYHFVLLIPNTADGGEQAVNKHLMREPTSLSAETPPEWELKHHVLAPALALTRSETSGKFRIVLGSQFSL